jgi:3-dehydroquinate synthase
MVQVRVNTPSKAYDIEIETGLLKRLPQIFRKRYYGRRIALISDDRVFELYGKSFVHKLQEQGFETVVFTFPEGEEHKNIRTVEKIYCTLADASFTRSDYVVALGGGVTGDIAGFAAATFLRGLGFIQIPTTLLAMIDSSVGGKTAVDMEQGKNLIGAFYQPDAVYTDPGLLDSLDDRLFSDGLAELVKHGLIRDRELFERLEMLGERTSIAPHLEDLISTSCRIKASVVEQDEHDNGIRQILNFGHTIGHAVEKVRHYRGITHGEAVAVGMVFITRMTERLGLTRRGTADRISQTLASFHLPVAMPSDIRPEDLAKAIMIDKKSRSGTITVAYLRDIGDCCLVKWSFKELEDNLFAEFKN